MYHKTDHALNSQIADLNKVKINVSFKKMLITTVAYFLLLPIFVYLAITTQYDIIIYLYLTPLAPIIFVTYAIFTGKLKWLIKIAHKLHALRP